MTSVFISYSRADQTFTRKLYDALEKNGRDTWIDWEDIPYSADWWREICAAIDGAETVVVILTPDSLSSRVCTLEIEYARKGGKRIIPIVHRPVDERGLLSAEIAGRLRGQEWEPTALENWAELGRLNWLYFREGDDFDRAFTALEETIDRDLNHVKSHTRLWIRAREWENASRDGSRLLRGDDLRAAEVWLAASATKTPQPTPLHVEFVTASRASATRQQRILMVSLTVGIIVMAVLAVFGLVQSRAAQLNLATSEARGTEVALQAITATIAQGQAEENAAAATIAQGEAEDNEETAVANAATATVAQGLAQNNAATAVAAQATSDRRAEEAQSVLWSNYAEAVATADNAFLALPLALAANRIPDPPEQAHQILEALAYSADVLYQYPGEEVVNTVAFSPDESQILSASADGTFTIWDRRSGTVSRTVRTGTTDVYSAFYSPDGQFIVTASYISGPGRGTLIVWDAASAEIIWRKGAQDMGLTGGVHYAIYSPDGATIAAAGCVSTGVGVCSRAKIILLDALTGEVQAEFEGHNGDIMRLAYSPDGRWLVSAGDFGDATLIRWDVDPASPTFGEAMQTFSGHDSGRGIRGLAYSPDGKTLLSGGDDGLLIWWDAETGLELARFAEHTSAVWGVAFSPDGRYALSGDRSAVMLLWDLTTRALVRRYDGAHREDVRFITYSADGSRALSGSRDGSMVLWNLQSTQRQRQLRLEDHLVRALAYSPDGQTMLSGGLGGELVLWDVATGTALKRWDYPRPLGTPFTLISDTPWVTDIAYSADSTHALVSYGQFFDGNTVWWDLSREFPEMRLETDYERGILSVAISPDGRYALTGRSSEASSGLWDLTTGRQVFTLPAFTFEISNVNAVAFTRDSRFAITAHSSGAIRFWDVTSGQMERQILPNAGGINGLAVSPDGSLLLSAAEDFSLIMWDIATGEEIRRFVGHSDIVHDVVFSPDGKTALSSSADLTGILWDVTTGEIIDRFNVGFLGEDVAFSPDGQTMVVSGGGITLRQIETLQDLLAWTVNNRPVRELTCSERLAYSVPPYCAEDGTYPTRTPFLLTPISVTPTP